MAHAIKVSNVWFSAEDEVTGELLGELVLTEQCDRCGNDVFVLRFSGPDGPHYTCDQCGMVPPKAVVADDQAVWQ
jgi:predicted RNA-binding Zn-ribbon protein involved in translation (DUF1610 family)